MTCAIADMGFAMKIRGSKIIRNGVEELAEDGSLRDVRLSPSLSPSAFSPPLSLPLPHSPSLSLSLSLSPSFPLPLSLPSFPLPLSSSFSLPPSLPLSLYPIYIMQ